MSTHEAQVHLAIGSRFEEIELVQVVVESTLRQLELDEPTASGIGLAVREAVANAIQHGNREDPGKKVRVDLDLEAGELTVRVCDEGDGFDPARVADPLSPENLLRSEGRGVFFMRRFMDEIDYSFLPDGGTVVTLRKRLAGPAKEPSSEQEESH